MKIKSAENKTKIINKINTGADEIVAPISFGFLKYCNGVASILKPQALYNSRSAIVRNERIIMRIEVYSETIVLIFSFVKMDCSNTNKNGRMQM